LTKHVQLEVLQEYLVVDGFTQLSSQVFKEEYTPSVFSSHFQVEVLQEYLIVVGGGVEPGQAAFKLEHSSPGFTKHQFIVLQYSV